jgi:hypothetical protein
MLAEKGSEWLVKTAQVRFGGSKGDVRSGNGRMSAYGTAHTARDTIPGSSVHDPAIALFHTLPHAPTCGPGQ